MSTLRRSWPDISRPGTPATRRALLFAGLALLTLVNYLDLVGVLGLAWTNNFVGWIAAAWTWAVALLFDPGEELEARLKDFGPICVALLAVIAIAYVSHPDIGTTYLLQATLIGQPAYAAMPTVGNGAAVLFIAWVFQRGLSWLSEYRHLRRTTAEERVFGEDR